MRANRLDAAAAAREYGLPIEAITEALDYAERFGELIEADAIEDLRRTGRDVPDA